MWSRDVRKFYLRSAGGTNDRTHVVAHLLPHLVAHGIAHSLADSLPHFLVHRRGEGRPARERLPQRFL